MRLRTARAPTRPNRAQFTALRRSIGCQSRSIIVLAAKVTTCRQFHTSFSTVRLPTFKVVTGRARRWNT